MQIGFMKIAGWLCLLIILTDQIFDF